MDPVHDMLMDAAVRRANSEALLRGFELTDVRHHVLDVGPDRESVTNAEMVRNVRPGRPRLNAALAALARTTHVPASRRAPEPSTPARPSTPAARAADYTPLTKCERCGYAADAHQHRIAHGPGRCPDTGGRPSLARR